MGRILIINGSPRAPKSNSKRYAELFMKYCSAETVYFNLTRRNHRELCEQMAGYTDVLFVFPLYADALPVGFLEFLKELETCPPARKPVVSILINCGFLEYTQNAIAIEMMRLYCRKNEYRLGSILELGSGEAILGTPFKYVAVRAIKRLARSVARGEYRTIQATMPLSKRLFVWASTVYWTAFGRKFGVSKSQMQTMQIEDGRLPDTPPTGA